ncbi:small integral membrane protein 22 isoform X1 [Canis lupus familiaris]|uniref:small integral membrane protein 22 isoform X1 n=1 Tax=Canis lupus familiaris TaxID=9615 RepID=UPI000BAA2B57|nr:small integral membrane protein 22 isoform X1 [Canis lupus familiaris]XP_025272408.1 small integral membrane protein 22 isoform X1 [Canis lupus dingo]XP_025272409.1 small integral membrane protein 22 isoform X1 [Canis lupus dingo]XP_038396422.1 small integral membrane protein 22 isoform X1 [Canis lupus familiaris]XP_038396423.1 small integral membrane protein 22 isoform X1 [Canis lupus familiaris]XP_038404038.1 small integral membrane protein 22 isoform X1 [Canis lupus familiaris]XP_038525|eukprot:XP_022275809.1 small integral membrane protein 22 isoform X1 [Canis lupus familiaris]
MDLAEDLGKELETTAQEVLGKLRSHTLFQSKWDTAALIIFLIFLGTVLLFLLLVCIHCCCYSCCSRRVSRPQKLLGSLEDPSKGGTVRPGPQSLGIPPAANYQGSPAWTPLTQKDGQTDRRSR